MTERGKRITGERAKCSTRMCGIDKCQQVGAIAKKLTENVNFNGFSVWQVHRAEQTTYFYRWS